MHLYIFSGTGVFLAPDGTELGDQQSTPTLDFLDEEEEEETLPKFTSSGEVGYYTLSH